MSKTLYGAELMTVGDPDGRGIHFSEADLHSIADSFRALGLTGRVPLKFGHNDEQPMTDGQPALGWVSRVWVDGNRLLADFSDMPVMVYNAIKKKLYKFVSVELLRNVKASTRNIPYVLDAVALLGADQPAFGTLGDLSSLTMHRRSAFRAASRVAFKRATFSTTEDKQMDEKDVQAAVERALGPVKADFTAKLDAQEVKYTAALAAKDAELAKERLSNHRKDVVSVFNAAVAAGTIEPAVREKFERLTGLNDDARAMSVKKEDAELFIKDNAKPASKNAKLKAGGGAEDDEEAGTHSQIVLARANKICLSRGVKPTDASAFNSAIQDVLRADKVLATKYFEDPNGKKEAV